MSDDYFTSYLPPGSRSRVNLRTREGANAYLEAFPGYLAVNLNGIHSFRAQLELATATGDAKAAAERYLERSYTTFKYVAHFSDVAAFEAALNTAPSTSSSNQLLLFWRHAESVLQMLSDDRQWKATGHMKAHDLALFQCLSVHCEHLIACRILLDQTTLLKTMASFLRNCDNPSGLVCEDFLATLGTIQKVMCRYLEKSWDEIYGLFEKTGVLGQALRCFAYPTTQGRPGFSDYIGDFLDYLMEASGVVRKYLKPGTPTGDILVALVKRKGIRPNIHNRLQHLSRLASYTANSRSRQTKRMCLYCNKGDVSEEFQASLKLCQRCKVAYYCNRECQVADWKSHKRMCQPPHNKESSQWRKIAEECTSSFLKENYFLIMTEMVNAMNIGNYQKPNALMVLDFVADANGVAPALKTPPVFSFVSISDVINGVDVEPNWLYTTSDGNVEKLQGWRHGVVQMSEITAPNELVIVSRAGPEATNVSKVQSKTHDNQAEQFSNDAAQAFSLAMDGDYSGLRSHFGDGEVYEYLHQQCLRRRGTVAGFVVIRKDPDK